MSPRHAAALPALWWSLAWAAPASADAAPCERVGVEAEPGLRAAHPALADEVRQALEGREGLEPCARVELGLERSSILVGVTLADGRTATRLIADARDVVPVVEALLLVPELDAEPPRAESTAAPAPKPATPARPMRRLLSPELGATPVPLDVSRTGIEFSLAAGARLGDGQSALGLGAVSFLELSGWLLGLGLRADRYQGASEEYAVMELLALFGHRFRLRHAAVDLVAGPALALHTQSTVEAGPAGQYHETGTEPIPRFAVAGHVHFGPASSLHPFVGIESEIGPGRTIQEPGPTPPELPAWTLGVAFGASVGTR